MIIPFYEIKDDDIKKGRRKGERAVAKLALWRFDQRAKSNKNHIFCRPLTYSLFCSFVVVLVPSSLRNTKKH
jgi:hypothetical protein